MDYKYQGWDKNGSFCVHIPIWCEHTFIQHLPRHLRTLGPSCPCWPLADAKLLCAGLRRQSIAILSDIYLTLQIPGDTTHTMPDRYLDIWEVHPSWAPIGKGNEAWWVCRVNPTARQGWGRRGAVRNQSGTMLFDLTAEVGGQRCYQGRWYSKWDLRTRKDIYRHRKS